MRMKCSAERFEFGDVNGGLNLTHQPSFEVDCPARGTINLVV